MEDVTNWGYLRVSHLFSPSEEVSLRVLVDSTVLAHVAMHHAPNDHWSFRRRSAWWVHLGQVLDNVVKRRLLLEKKMDSVLSGGEEE